MTAGQLTFRNMERTEADLALFKGCFDLNDSPKALDLLRWQFFDVPAPGLNVDFAMDHAAPGGPIVAAVYATFPVSIRVGARVLPAVQSIDTMTDGRYRGRGLFVKLAAQVYERCAREGKALVYGMPNANSAHGFFTKLGWQSLDPMPFVARPLRSGYVLSKLRLGGTLSKLMDVPLPLPARPRPTSAFDIRSGSAIDDQVHRVWQDYCADRTCGLERDADYLRWRLARPGEQYEVLGWYEDQLLKGYAIIGLRDTAGTKSGKLMELLYDPRRPEVGSGLASEALHRLRDAGCGIVWAWNFPHSANHGVLKGAGFIDLPQRFWPLELHIGVRDFSGDHPLLNQRSNWYVSMLECDTD